MDTKHYPASPANIDMKVINPGIEYKKNVVTVFVAILFFFFVYLLLVLLSVCLFAVCVLGGFALIVTKPMAITIMVGLGLIGMGAMVLYFLVKFIFVAKKANNSGNVEVTAGSQPVLFAFIKKLSEETGIQFPKKIFLTPDVNASVYYDSNFWSMILPVKKNLNIGLGLVNVLNISELKAVIAHEFGHFSQKSMKLGSFVYNVNRVIYNMLYDNQGWSNSLNSFAGASRYFHFFASLSVGIVQGIQVVLKNMYAIVNKKYMALSREMEFHADAVSASVSGSASLVSALKKIGIGDGCYNSVINKCNSLIGDNKFLENIYPFQEVLLNQFVTENKLPVNSFYNLLKEDYADKNYYARVSFQNQWASHPTTDERVNRLKALNIQAVTDELPAWLLFEKKESVQKEVSDKLYQSVKFEGEKQPFTTEEYVKELKENDDKFSQPEIYQGYYSNRDIELFDVDELSAAVSSAAFSENDFSKIFTADALSLPKRITTNETDIATLEGIRENSKHIKSFDFDGKKYQSYQAVTVINPLKEENAKLANDLKESDNRLFSYAYWRALAIGGEQPQMLKEWYKNYFNADETNKELNDSAMGIIKHMEDIFAGKTIAIETIKNIISQLTGETEPAFKKELAACLEKGVFDDHGNEKIKDSIEKYLAVHYTYFEGRSFHNDQIFKFRDVLFSLLYIRHLNKYKQLKAMLVFQASLLQTQEQLELRVV